MYRFLIKAPKITKNAYNKATVLQNILKYSTEMFMQKAPSFGRIHIINSRETRESVLESYFSMTLKDIVIYIMATIDFFFVVKRHADRPNTCSKFSK